MTERPERVATGIKHFRCGDVVPGCTARFEGRERHVMNEVERHAATAHGIPDVDDDLRGRVRRAFRSD